MLPEQPEQPDQPKPSEAPFPVEPIHPDLLAWVRQTFDPKEFEDALREYEEKGGHSLESFIDEVERRALGK